MTPVHSTLPLFLERVCRAYSRPDVAYRLLQLRFDVRATKPGPFRSSQGGRPRPPSFSLVPGASPLQEWLTRGEPRSVHSRWPQCWFLPLARACPAVMPPRLPHHRKIALTVHSEDRRARVEEPSEGRVTERMRRSLVPATGAYALWRMPTSFPSSAAFGHPLSSARSRVAEDTAARLRTDLGLRSNDAPRRAPLSRRPGCLSPSRIREGNEREGIAPSGLRAGSLAHAAHTFSPDGRVFLMGIARSRCGHPRGP